MYDPALGRWHTTDHLAERSRDFTPYNFVYNNPVNCIDPNGLEPGEVDGGGGPPEMTGSIMVPKEGTGGGSGLAASLVLGSPAGPGGWAGLTDNSTQETDDSQGANDGTGDPLRTHDVTNGKSFDFGNTELIGHKMATAYRRVDGGAE